MIDEVLLFNLWFLFCYLVLVEDTSDSACTKCLQQADSVFYSYGAGIPDDELPEEFRVTSDSTANDLLMAQMLQMEFDKEADKMLKREQDHYNRNNKVCSLFWLAPNVVFVMSN